ncbi:MAG TPA: hypothetical protein VF478_06670 [Anaerolineae bacterium]
MSRFRIVGLTIVCLLVLAACAPITPPSPTAGAPTSVPQIAPSTPMSAPPIVPTAFASTPNAQPPTPTGTAPVSDEIRFSDVGNTSFGEWHTEVVASPAKWAPGAAIKVQATLRISDPYLNVLAQKGVKPDAFIMLVTAERTFDPDGILRLPSDERMSTLLTPTGLGIEGGTQGAVSKRVGYAFRTPVDELVTVPISVAQKIDTLRQVTFNLTTKLPDDLPPGIYRLRLDYGATVKNRQYNLNADTFAQRGFPKGPCDSLVYSPPIRASAKNVAGKMIDAAAIQPRVPWVLLANYNSNGYRGAVAGEDRKNFVLSNRNLIQDDVILPMYDENNPKNILAYTLEPQFPTDSIDDQQNIPWDYARGELTVRITQPDGKTIDLGTAPFVGNAGRWPTTRNTKFTQWKPPMYGQ